MTDNNKSDLIDYGSEAMLDMGVESPGMEEEVMAVEAGQEPFIDNDANINSENADNLFESANNHKLLEADNKEIDMENSLVDLPQDTVSDEVAIDAVVEPVINLDATLTIQNVVKLYEDLKKSYSVYNLIEINASCVSSIDTATLQLLVALKKDAVKQQKEVVFTAPSPRFIESAELLGLLQILDIDP